MPDTAVTRGAHHIGLTVPNLAETRAFFVDTLGFEQLGEIPDYPAVFLSDGSTMITLWQAVDPKTAVPFDRKNVIGLHHFALKVDDQKTLTDIHAKLELTENVDVEFSPEPLMGGPTNHMMCTIPGGIRMEIVAPAN
ncbi:MULTISPECIES: VOC family protein [Roseobacteraceae]|uniref:VOC family protein n=1 Tax=Roseobacteraceae TaxID=2854170 RepID=UPI000DEA0336|nr:MULTISPECIES: VOC family protein [Roseobacteraceae]MBT8167493.1 VOC family protein [Falsiruegeria litorea]RBW57462.1 VOC family protein [Ruegeria sp. A3M17]